MVYSKRTTESLAQKLRLLLQLRQLRAECKIEAQQAPEQDIYLWMDTYATLDESILIMQDAIAALLPSGNYTYQRDRRKP